MHQLKYLLPICFSSLFLGLVIWLVEPPKSITTASLTQLALFLIPLLILLTLIFNLYFKFIFKSLILSFALTLLVILKALDSLNIIAMIITIIATLLLLKSIKKAPTHKGLRSLNTQNKIPKLQTLKKQR